MLKIKILVLIQSIFSIFFPSPGPFSHPNWVFRDLNPFHTDKYDNSVLNNTIYTPSNSDHPNKKSWNTKHKASIWLPQELKENDGKSSFDLLFFMH